ncbi:MAG: CDGSH iron-sulfur domain-containing protein [Alsobacter sp.]
MTKPAIAGTSPLPVDVTAGQTYWWCACGQSKNQPFCDGSHKGSSFTPHAWTADADKKVWFCACKQTGNSPLCDGSHKKL